MCVFGWMGMCGCEYVSTSVYVYIYIYVCKHAFLRREEDVKTSWLPISICKYVPSSTYHVRVAEGTSTVSGP